MHTILNDYIATKLAAATAKREANAAISTEGEHALPEHCDKEAILNAFTQLAKANKNARAIVDGIDGAQVYAEAEAKRAEKRVEKMKAESEALETAINARLDAILADDTRRALLIMEAQTAAELAAQSAQSGDVENVA